MTTSNKQNDPTSESKPKKKFPIRGILTVLAGFILMFYNGSVFFVGNIEPYIYSFYEKSTISEA